MEKNQSEVWKSIYNLPEKKCFGCGKSNPHGLQLDFESNGKMVRTQITIPARLSGWENLTHGGIIATIIDETLAWTVIYLKRMFILTKNIYVEFKKPIFIGDKILAEGFIEEERGQKEVLAKVVLTNQKGEEVAFGRGWIATYDKEGIDRFGFLDTKFLMEFDEKVLKQ